ncbi:protein scabrous-like [Centruroides sculpturatus]|uniref:protein scabrous-like n=1 Tax=Centruroides sculpturatus TaxID=218467 RepID=UPI000C6CA7AF|nr:protein scabrous-like [Centruroides sculpturatus]
MKERERMLRWLYVISSLAVWTIISADGSGNTRQLARLVNDLQSQLTVLQKEHAEDQETIRQLEKLLSAKSPNDGLENLELQLKELKRSLSEIVKSPVTRGSADVTDIRTETTTLRNQLQHLRQEVSTLQARQEESNVVFGQLRTTQITTKWLQRKVDELRSEIREVAAVLNVSSGLNQLQKFDSNLELLKSDFRALRRDYDQMVASQERENAGLIQLKQDAAELREIMQRLALNNQRLDQQVEDLDSMRQKVLNKKNNEIEFYKMGEEHEYNGHEENMHRHRHHRHIKSELSKMKEILRSLERSQIANEKEMNSLRTNYKNLNMTVEQLKKNSDHLKSQSRSLQTEQGILRRQVGEVLESVNKMEDTTGKNSAAIINMTETAGGVDKLHSSTMQLFEALETIEGEYGNNIGELQKEVSKLEFNVAQIQSSFQVIRQEQSNHRDMLKMLKKDMSLNQLQSQRNHIELTLLQTELLNHTLQSCKTLKSELLQNRVKTLEGRIDRVYAELRLKVDTDATNQWKNQQKALTEEVEKVNSLLPSVEQREENLEKQIKKFVRRLPRDCSSVESKESKVNLIHIPGLSDPKEVFCDTKTDGGQWTIIQKRQNGEVQFDRKWDAYKEGFGDAENEYWIGNEALHLMTSSDNYTLRIDMWDMFGRYKYAQYNMFLVMSEHDGYRLAIGAYSGNASNALEYHNSMEFSTSDRDNDASNTNCAMYYSSGWWYNHCQFVNINGKYKIGLTWYDIDSHEWIQLKKVEMKIRPRR